MPFGLSSVFGWWNTLLVSVVKILSLLTAPHPVPTPKSAQALFGHQVCRAGLASEPGSLSCLGSSAPPYSPLWLTLRTSHRVLGDSSAWNAAKLVKGCSNKAPSGTTCWSRGQGDGVESVTCIGRLIWLWNPLISSVFPFLLILRMGRFSPELLYYVVVLIKKETLKKVSFLRFMTQNFTKLFWLKFALILQMLQSRVLCYVCHPSSWETEAGKVMSVRQTSAVESGKNCCSWNKKTTMGKDWLEGFNLKKYLQQWNFMHLVYF